MLLGIYFGLKSVAFVSEFLLQVENIHWQSAWECAVPFLKKFYRSVLENEGITLHTHYTIGDVSIHFTSIQVQYSMYTTDTLS